MVHRLAIAIVLIAFPALASTMPQGLRERMADAIWHAEGGEKARVPYGILSVKVRSKDHARQITLRSIDNNWKRWERAGYPGDFVSFMGRRWAPPHLSPKNKNWPVNVRKRL